MLHLPPGQGFSIYSLAAVLPLLPAKQRPTHANDWMTTRRRGRLPRSQLLDPAPHHAHRAAPLQPAADHRRSASQGLTRVHAAYRLSPGYEISRVIRGGWQLAGGHGAVGERRSGRRHDRLRRCRHHHLRLRRHLYRRRGADRRVPRALPQPARRGGALRASTSTPSSCPTSTSCRRIDKAYVERRHRHLAAAPRMERLDLVQFHWWDYDVPRWLETRGMARGAAAGRQDRHASAAPISTRAHLLAMRRGRRAAVLDAGAVFAARPPARKRRMVDGGPDNDIALFCYGTVAGGFLGDRWLGTPEPKAPLENRSLVKYKLIIDDFGGWELFQELLPALRRHRRPPRHRHRHGRERRGAGDGPASPPSSSARATARISPPISRIADARADARRPRARSTPCSPRAASSKAMSTRWSATARAATARS